MKGVLRDALCAEAAARDPRLEAVETLYELELARVGPVAGEPGADDAADDVDDDGLLVGEHLAERELARAEERRPGGLLGQDLEELERE